MIITIDETDIVADYKLLKNAIKVCEAAETKYGQQTADYQGISVHFLSEFKKRLNQKLQDIFLEQVWQAAKDQLTPQL